MASNTAKAATNIAKPWQPSKAASLSPLGSLAALPFKASYIAINNIANPWQPWLAALPVSGPFWQPSKSRLQGCHWYPGGGSVGPDISNVGADNAYTARLEGSHFARPKVIRITIAAALASVYRGRQNRAGQRRAGKLRRRNFCHRRAGKVTRITFRLARARKFRRLNFCHRTADAPEVSDRSDSLPAVLAAASVYKCTQNRTVHRRARKLRRRNFFHRRAEKCTRVHFCHRRADAC